MGGSTQDVNDIFPYSFIVSDSYSLAVAQEISWDGRRAVAVTLKYKWIYEYNKCLPCSWHFLPLLMPDVFLALHSTL